MHGAAHTPARHVGTQPGLLDPNHAACQGTAHVIEDHELTGRLAALTAWSVGDDGQLRRRLRFDTFTAAFAFATSVALLAERRNHHPTIHLDKRELQLTVWTRKLAAVTDLDIELAEAIEQLVEDRR